MIHLLAQTTQPADSVSVPSWAQAMLAFITAVGVLVAAGFPVYMLLLGKIKDAAIATREAISEVKATAAANTAGVEAAQNSIDRLASSQRTDRAATVTAMTAIAAQVPPPANPVSASLLQQSLDTLSGTH